jgi:thiamine biosynthesis lipoprotein
MTSKQLDKIIFFILTISLVLAVSGCRRQKEWHKTTFLFFDTVCQAQLQASDSTFHEAEQAIQDVFSQIEDRFSPGSVDYQSSEVVELFRTAHRIHQNSAGSFDITVAPLSELWGFRSGKHVVPSEDEIQIYLRRTGMDKVHIKDNTLAVPENITLDWGGIAKGRGIDLAWRECKTMNISNGFINAGGDLICWGENPQEENWRIGVTHPRQDGFLGILHISNIGAATTGDYQRFFMSNGKRYHHILNPKTGRPANGKQSATVIGPETAVCDGLATALFVSEEPESILSHYPEYGAILVMDDGELIKLGKPYPFQKL